MKTPFVTAALVGALAQAFDFDWADDILGDYTNYNFSKPAPKSNYARSSDVASKLLGDLNNGDYYDSLYAKPSYKKTYEPKVYGDYSNAIPKAADIYSSIYKSAGTFDDASESYGLPKHYDDRYNNDSSDEYKPAPSKPRTNRFYGN